MLDELLFVEGVEMLGKTVGLDGFHLWLRGLRSVRNQKRLVLCLVRRLVVKLLRLVVIDPIGI